jgi:pyridine nucleotide-disulfide oxidoreductase
VSLINTAHQRSDRLVVYDVRPAAVSSRTPRVTTGKILGCHVIGERAMDIVEVAAIAIAAGMRVGDLAPIPLAYPTYAEIMVGAAVGAARQLSMNVSWQAREAAQPT